jgi:hypothetical protein
MLETHGLQPMTSKCNALGDAQVVRLQCSSPHRLLMTGKARRDCNEMLHVGAISHQGASRWRRIRKNKDLSSQNPQFFKRRMSGARLAFQAVLSVAHPLLSERAVSTWPSGMRSSCAKQP